MRSRAQKPPSEPVRTPDNRLFPVILDEGLGDPRASYLRGRWVKQVGQIALGVGKPSRMQWADKPDSIFSEWDYYFHLANASFG
jgi:hypothetical protein